MVRATPASPDVTASTRVAEKPDCGCGTAVAQKSKARSSVLEQTFTGSAQTLCPKDLLSVDSGIFVYATIECSTGKAGGKLLFYPHRVQTGCNGSGGCKTSVIPMGGVDTRGRNVDREYLKEVVAKFRADLAGAELRKLNQPQLVAPPTPDE